MGSKMEQLNAVNSSETATQIAALFDEGSFKPLDVLMAKNGEISSVISGYGYVNGNPAYAFAQNNEIKNGAIDRTAAAKITKIYSLAAKTGAPVVGIYNSSGGDISEGTDVLGAYGDIAKAAAKLSGVVPQIAVVTGVCAGSMAMTACLADFVIMTEKAELFMTPPFLTDNSKSGSAENAAKCGVAAITVKDANEAVKKAGALLSILPSNNLSAIPADEYDYTESDIDGLKGEALINAIADDGSVSELYKEQGAASFVGIGTIGGSTVGFTATNKTDKKLTGEDCSKIARFIMTMDAFSIPIVTIIDTEGFEAENGAEIRSQSKLLSAYANATTVKISLIAGNAFGSAYVALAGGIDADFVIAYENAVISPLNPAAMVQFLQGDKLKDAKERAALEQQYIKTEAGPYEAAARGYADIVADPIETRDILISVIDAAASKRETNLPRKHANIPF